jgi:hypothetical protein
MMSIEQHDLSRLAAELAEVQQAIGKAIQHGLDDCNPETKESNFDAIQREIFDAIYFMKRLNIKLQWSSQEEFNSRDVKYEKWLQYSIKKGTVELNKP